MPIKTKRWDDPIESDDGTRILVARYRPRALRKELETWSEWWADLGPSAALHAAFYGKSGPPMAWSVYRGAYLGEMLAAKDRISTLAQRVIAGEQLTLLCSTQCVRESRCHRSLLRDLIDAEVVRLCGSPGA